MRLSWLNMVTVIYSTNASSINWEKEEVGLGKGDLFEWYALCKSVDKSLFFVYNPGFLWHFPYVHLHFPHRIIQALCEHGADASLTDIEGNTSRDLADKNGQHKCAKYLATALKQKVSQGSSGKVRVSMLCTILEHLHACPLNCLKNEQKNKLATKLCNSHLFICHAARFLWFQRPLPSQSCNKGRNDRQLQERTTT